MSPPSPRLLTVALGCAVLTAGLVLRVQGEPPAPLKPPAKPAEKRRLELREKLAKPATLERAIDNTSLKDVLEFLSDRYDLTLLVDTEAFKRDNGVANIEEQQVKLPKLSGVRLGAVMDLLLKQVNGAYVVRRDYIEITTREAAVRKAPELQPLVTFQAKRQRLDQALDDLADEYDANIVLQSFAADDAMPLVTVRLANVPLATAVRAIAEQAGLKVARMENVFFVTTAEKARKIEEEEKGRRAERTLESCPPTLEPVKPTEKPAPPTEKPVKPADKE